jgi:hypothetical protein
MCVDCFQRSVKHCNCHLEFSLMLRFLDALFEFMMFSGAATDDTQRMMQMSGFGFDPSKVQF